MVSASDEREVARTRPRSAPMPILYRSERADRRPPTRPSLEDRFVDILQSRSREFMPQVLLTVLSIIQALALEVLWSSIHATPHLWRGGFPALLGWLQALATFLGIVVMWIFYVSLVMRFRWTPRVNDTVVPFVLGVLEFTMAELLEPGYVHLWLYLLATIFAGASATSLVLISRAGREDEHLEESFGEELRAATGPNAILACVLVGTLVAAGAAVQVAGPDGAIALAAVLAALAVLLVQAMVIRQYWNRSLRE
jgi:hypothetical protein